MKKMIKGLKNLMLFNKFKDKTNYFEDNWTILIYSISL